jgi:hypothetical protein
MTSADQVDSQIHALIDIIGRIGDSVSALSSRVDRLAAGMESGGHADGPTAPWLLTGPAVVAEDPTTFVADFVDYYNGTYAGLGGRAKSIPACWREHPGLVAEVAALAYAWRAANRGRGANIRDAEHWLHQWRPGFADRMARDWVPADCFDSHHVDANGQHQG